MKKLVAFFVIVLFTMICSAHCSAQMKLEKNNKGDYRFKTDTLEWVNTNIVAEPEAIRYIKNFSQAISAPNSFILIEKSEKILKMVGPFKALKKTTERGIYFDSSENKIVFIEKKEELEIITPLLIFGMLSVILMIISSILKKEKRAYAALTTAALAALVVALTTFIVATVITALVAATALGAALVVAATAESNHKASKIFVVIYYIIMTAYFILMFSGI